MGSRLRIKERLRYYEMMQWLRFKLQRRWKEPVIAVSSLAKSGTTYFRLVLGNYIQIRYGDPSVPVTYGLLSKSLFPNRILSSLRPDLTYTEPPPDHPIRRTRYRDVLWGHDWRYPRLFRADSRIVHLYRNPLDSLISQYFYFWVNRPEKDRIHEERPEEPIDGPFSFFPYMIDEYASHYVRARAIAERRSHMMRVSYESLVSEPTHVFSLVIPWLGLKLCRDSLATALDRASRKSVQREEEETGQAVHAFEGFRGSFVRSGKIGEWRDHLDPGQVSRIEEELERRGISLSEFQLLPEGE